MDFAQFSNFFSDIAYTVYKIFEMIFIGIINFDFPWNILAITLIAIPIIKKLFR